MQNFVFQTLKILTGSIERLTKEVVPVIQKSTPPVTPELPVITSPEQVGFSEELQIRLL